MADITVVKLNEVWMKVVCNEIYMEMDIQDRFSFQVGNQFDPRVKHGQWDGIKRLYNRKNKKMYTGLLYKLLEFCDKKGFSTHIDPDLIPKGESLEDEDLYNLYEFINPHSGGNKLDVYDYQHDAVKYMLNMNRTTCLAATSAGKSLIVYLAVRIYQLLEDLHGKKIVIIVPNKSLVNQLYSDFDDYSTCDNQEWYAYRNVKKLSGDYDKNIDDHQIVITTWQTWCKFPSWVYEEVGALIVDEVHGASANVLTNILESSTKTSIRHGLTGTLDGLECNELVVQGLLGPSKRIVTSKELIEQGRASGLNINVTILKHCHTYAKEVFDEKKGMKGKSKYEYELGFINANQERRNFIKQAVSSVSGNTLVAFDRVENYGKPLYEEYKEEYGGNVFLIVGATEADEREQIRKLMEDYDDAVIFASYGTMSTGVSIKKLHNLFLISSSKSVIRVLQTLGRMMRLHKSKTAANIFDIVDDLTYEGNQNYMMVHAQDRIQMYHSEGYDINFNRFDIKRGSKSANDNPMSL